MFENPEKKEGTDFRIPPHQRFKEWRSFLGPVCHYLSVSVIKLAVRTHLLHDATTKDGISVFQTTARVELKGEEGEGMIVVEMPVKFDLLPAGDADTEADLVEKSLHSDLGDGVHASLLHVVSNTSDNAARATSRGVADRKAKLVEQLQAMSAAALEQAPDELAHAATLWSEMSEEQRKVAHTCHELGCTGHSVNLTIDDSHKKTEKEVLEKNVERDLAIITIQRFGWHCLGYLGQQLRTNRRTCRVRGPFWCRGNHVGGKRVREAGKHVPVGPHYIGSDLPDVSSLLLSLSKAFSSSGDDAQYYLNESKHLARWADSKGLALAKVPSRKGSRQGWTVAAATAVMLNGPVYTQYLDAVRADDANLNKLIERSWDGVRDRYAMSAVSARSFIDVAFAIPLNFFVHSKFVTRGTMRSVMECTAEWINGLGELDDVGMAKPPAVDSLASLILSKHPEWKDKYEAWYEAEGEGLKRAFTTATGNDRWQHVSAHLKASAKPMIVTHLRNLDKDCSGIAELVNAPCLSDVVESGFGCFDYLLDKTKASVESAMGTAHSMKMKAMTNDEELERKAEREVSNKRRQGGGVGGKEAVRELVRKWKILNWRHALPQSERLKVIRSLQRHLRVHGEQRRKKRLELADAAVARKVAGVKKADNRRLKKVAFYLKHNSTTPITTQATLKALEEEHEDSLSTYATALRDQIRVRQHVYAMSGMPNIGTGSDDAELKRLEAAVLELLTTELPPKPPQPTADFRPAAAAPTAAANTAYARHLQQTVAAYRELIALTKEGIFRLPRDDGSDDEGEDISSTTNTSKRSRATPAAAPRKKKERRVKANELELVGASFEEEGVDWKVLDVQWSDEVDEVVVYYFDVVAVESEGVTEDDLHTALEEQPDANEIEHIEYSRVSEVKAWLKLSQKARKGR